MIYRVTLKFNGRYITKFENGTWDEIKTFYGSRAIAIVEGGKIKAKELGV